MGSPNAFSTAAPAILAAGMLAALLGCTENTQSPTDAETSSSPPGFATASAALVFREMSAGGLHSCAVTEADRAYCWGAGPHGQLGSGTTPLARLTPIAVIGGLAFRQISAGREFTCGVTTGDRAYCWGFNGNGQLGDGTQTSRLAPVAVKGNHRFRRVSAGYTHACAVTTDQRAFCWGLLGTDLPVALGNGSTVGSTIPVRVAGGLAFRHVSAGVFHSCGV